MIKIMGLNLSKEEENNYKVLYIIYLLYTYFTIIK